MYEVDKYTVSLLHFEDGIKDEMGKLWTANSGAAVSTVQSKIGGSSLYLNGSQHISMPMSDDLKLVSNDFTIDFWMYTSNSGGSPYGIQLFNTTVDRVFTGISLCYVGNTIYGGVSVNGTSWITATNTITLNEWNHIAFIKSGNNLYVAVNGVLGAPTVINGNPLESSQSYAIIGNLIEESTKYHYTGYTGYIDEFRISKGIARWTSDFKPELTLNATIGDAQVTLSWTAVDGATSYNVKRSTTVGETYQTIASNVIDTSYIDTSVTNGITYYYVVTAVDNTNGESEYFNEASATPVSSSKYLLRITMNDSSEREYLLTSTEIDVFINWYTRTVGTGTTCYTFNDTIDKSKEYLAFEKIISFKVIPTVE